MPNVQTLMADANDGRSRMLLTYNDQTMVAQRLDWVNPEGYWKWTIRRAGQPDIVVVLNPGDAGGRTIPSGYQWSLARGSSPNFTYSEEWALNAPPP